MHQVQTRRHSNFSVSDNQTRMETTMQCDTRTLQHAAQGGERMRARGTAAEVRTQFKSTQMKQTAQVLD